MKKTTKRLLAVLLAVCVGLTSFVMPAAAIDVPEAEWGTSADDLTGSGTFADAVASDAAYIQLQKGVTITSTVGMTDGVERCLDLNGCTITDSVDSDDGAIYVGSGSELTILDTATGGKVSGSNAIHVGTANLYLSGGEFISDEEPVIDVAFWESTTVIVAGATFSGTAANFSITNTAQPNGIDLIYVDENSSYTFLCSADTSGAKLNSRITMPDGWKLFDASGSVVPNDSGTIAAGTVITAKKDTRPVLNVKIQYGTIYGREGTVDQDGYWSPNTPVRAGDKVTISADSRTGYNFSGWELSAQSLAMLTNNSISTNSAYLNNLVFDSNPETTDFILDSNWTAITYKLTVSGGSYENSEAGNNYFKMGETVTITAKDPAAGKVFDKWTTYSSGVELADANSATTTFSMPANNVTVTANYKDAPAEPTTYLVKMYEGWPEKASYAAGETVKITANSHSGMVFSHWSVDYGDVTFADANASVTTFIMPDHEVKVSANFTVIEAKWGSGEDNLTNSGTFAEAIAAAEDHSIYIQLQKNVSITSQMNIDLHNNLDIDLNSHTISSNVRNALTFTDGGYVLIKDSSGDDGTIAGGNVLNFAGVDTVYLNSGNFVGGNSGDKGVDAPVSVSDGNIYLNGATFDADVDFYIFNPFSGATFRLNAAADSYSFYIDSLDIGAGSFEEAITAWPANNWGLFDSNGNALGDNDVITAGSIVVAKAPGEPAPTTYALTVNSGSGDGEYAEGASVTITADAAPEGKVFDKWTTNNGGSFADVTATSTTFTMPAGDVTVTATYKDAPGGEGGNEGGNEGGEDPAPIDPPVILPEIEPASPSTGSSDGWKEITDEIGSGKTEGKVEVEMNGTTKLPADVLSEALNEGTDLSLEMNDTTGWTLYASEMEETEKDLNLAVSVRKTGDDISLRLSQKGEFPGTPVLNVDLGSEEGKWANLYDAEGNLIHSCRVDENGIASWPMDEGGKYTVTLTDESAMDDGWTETPGGTWFHYDENIELDTHWFREGNVWYYLQNTGAMKTGWHLDEDGNWYYLSDWGGMKTGWHLDEDGNWYFLRGNGAMARDHWRQEDDGSWYYLDASGAMLKDTVTPDGYRVDANGLWVR